ncbi:hypothetical protein AAEU42_00545 [Pseudoflavonifractor phocaeensis]|uniref:hypothetical protein n=1 Tax=Pseudoflavonifractor phocaeensis TaxID=1870988 RepID=UPI00313BAAB1
MDRGKQVRRWLPAAGLLLAGLAGAVLMVDRGILPGASGQSRELIEKAVRRSAVQCYAIEGAYPVSLEELEERYGLRVDQERWMVDYRYVADNLSPDITVIQRQ